jgi:AraC-like DNA-binding protein
MSKNDKQQELSHFIKLCENLQIATGLWIELFDESFTRITHFPIFLDRLYPAEIVDCSKDYLLHTKASFSQLKGSAYCTHEYPDLALTYFDMRIESQTGSIYYLLVGPVLNQDYSEAMIARILSNHKLPLAVAPTFSAFYRRLSYLTSDIYTKLWLIYQTLCSMLSTEAPPHISFQQTTLTRSTQSIITSHEVQSLNQLLLNCEAHRACCDAIRHGDLAAARMNYRRSSTQSIFYQAAVDPLRRQKNLLLCSNGSMYSAALEGGVDCLRLHELNESLSIRIEQLQNATEIDSLGEEMVVLYCNLVRDSKLQGYSPLITRTIQYLYTYYNQPLTVQKVAAEIHCSKSYLSRRFCSETGQTMGQFLNRHRVQQAAKLLTSQRISITEVAELVGFSSYPKFSVEFKKWMGMSASLYQQKEK